MQALLFKSRLLRRPPRCRSCPTWTTPASSTITCSAAPHAGTFRSRVVHHACAPPTRLAGPVQAADHVLFEHGPFRRLVLRLFWAFVHRAPTLLLEFLPHLQAFPSLPASVFPVRQLFEGSFPLPVLVHLASFQVADNESIFGTKVLCSFGPLPLGPCQVQASYPWLAPAFFVQVKLPRQVKVGLL